MATLRQKILAEQDTRAMLDDHGLPQPDLVEYGETCIRLLWQEEKVAMVVDIDEPPSGSRSDAELFEAADPGGGE